MTTASLPDNAITAHNVYKLYESKTKRYALDDFSLTIPRGSLFGLLGPNGAGKSTFINILAGLVKKTAGNIHIWDINIDSDHREAKMRIGIVPQELNFDPFFTPRAMLDLQAGLYGVPPQKRQTEALLHMVGLTHKSEAYSRSLSGGMRRRLMIAKAMVHAPPILVLDEPTAGVDIELRQNLWQQIHNLKKKGTTIILTTHYLKEAEELCDRIAIINQGKLIADKNKHELLQDIDHKELHITCTKSITDIPPALKHFEAQILDSHRIQIRYTPQRTPIGHILEALQKTDLDIHDITTHQSDLEDVFLKLTHMNDDANV
ncbi:MAG: ABC transporter ATP-binding protein [Alphaproteobacteria bacterium GM202ARS2]|nr:ABC transporter ATP-binding protein [Alphaproteobacteria bacterium GM202ARS2]